MPARLYQVEVINEKTPSKLQGSINSTLVYLYENDYEVVDIKLSESGDHSEDLLLHSTDYL